MEHGVLEQFQKDVLTSVPGREEKQLGKFIHTEAVGMVLRELRWRTRFQSKRELGSVPHPPHLSTTNLSVDTMSTPSKFDASPQSNSNFSSSSFSPTTANCPPAQFQT